MNVKESLKRIVINLFSLFPVEEKTILFESNSEIKDNAKAIFDICLDKKINEKYKIIWFVDDIKKYRQKYSKYKNIKFIYKNKTRTTISLKRMYYSCTAKYCFYTHLLVALRKYKGQIKVFLTHGTPIKDTRGLFWKPELNTYIISTSDYAAKLRCQTFGGGNDRVKTLGFPRNDNLFKDNKNVEKYYNDLNCSKLILWLPTFKHFNIEKSNRNDFRTDSKTDLSILDDETLNEINNILKSYNSKLIIKFHPAQNMKYVPKKNYSNIEMMTNSELIDKNIELYSLMKYSDALITDYSSVYIDYLLLDRPIGFELKDYEEFKTGRGFIVDNPLELMPGEKILSKDDMLKFIKNVNEGKDEYFKDRKELRDKMHKYKDGNSSERILDFLNIK